MDSSGQLYTEEQMREWEKVFRHFRIPIDPQQVTAKQDAQARVSIHDHRSPLGQQLTALRQAKRNEPCPCGSGKKYKFCCMNV